MEEKQPPTGTIDEASKSEEKTPIQSASSGHEATEGYKIIQLSPTRAADERNTITAVSRGSSSRERAHRNTDLRSLLESRETGNQSEAQVTARKRIIKKLPKFSPPKVKQQSSIEQQSQ